jgi:DNA-binding transcriptional ArsR family regulator
MMPSIQFLLNPDELISMADLFDGRKSGVSPMRPEKSLTKEQIDSLKQRGILDESGKITSIYSPALETIAHAGYYTQVRLSGGSRYLECVIYFSRDYKRSAAVFFTNDGMLVQEPAPVNDISKGLRQFIGESVLQSSNFKAELAADDAVILSSLLDMQRRENLKTLAEDGDGTDRGFTLDEIIEAAGSSPDSAQWMVTVLREMTGKSPERESVHNSLENLLDSGLARYNGDRYFLADEPRELTNQLLLVNNLLSLKAGRELENGTAVQVGFVCLQEGVTDLLLVETSEDKKVRFESLSSALLFWYADLFLSDPVAIQMLIPDESAGSAAFSGAVSDKKSTAEKHCAGCMQELTPGALYCSACGKPVTRDAAERVTGYCSRCGSKLKPGDRYCSGCGAPTQ